MPIRGTYQFEVQDEGKLINNNENLERARKLFTDGAIISDNWGPGNAGDFDYGSWHCMCHLAAGAGVFKTPSGYIWVSITHAGDEDKYLTSVSSKGQNGEMQTLDLSSVEAVNALAQASLLGYVEGTSCGHTLKRNFQDAPNAFNNWPRQKFNHPADSQQAGGVVWEQWSTTRDLRPSSVTGTSVLKSYLTLVSLLGGEFVAAVARGRRSYKHPIQLCALVKSGFISREEALWNTMPYEIPLQAQRLLYEAQSVSSLKAVELLTWGQPGEKRYYMFKRSISSWSKKDSVLSDLQQFGI